MQNPIIASVHVTNPPIIRRNILRPKKQTRRAVPYSIGYRVVRINALKIVGVSCDKRVIVVVKTAIWRTEPIVKLSAI